jgi:glycosyltransferase involved in cell wall biosynthesis
VKVALYYPWLYLTSGAERTAYQYAQRSRHDIVLFTNRYDRDSTFPAFRDLSVVELDPVPVRRTPAAFARAVWTVLGQRLPLDGFDVLVVISEGIGDLLLFRNNTQPAVCLSLTPLRIAFDDHYAARFLATQPAYRAALIRAGAAAFRVADRIACRRYRRFIANGEETRRRLIRGGLASPSQIEILNPAITFHPSERSMTFEPFFLIAGRIMWTKNIELGIDAFRRFGERNPEYAGWRLVIAGIVDRKSEPYLEKLHGLAGSDNRISFMRNPSDAELQRLYATCYSVLYTPFNEDFGLIPLEAMAFGKPTIAVNRGGPLEVIGDEQDGLLRSPDPDSFAAAMATLAHDPARVAALGANGFLKSQRYSWVSFTERLDSILEEVAAEAGRGQVLSALNHVSEES